MAKGNSKSLAEMFGSKGSNLDKLRALKETGDKVGGGGGGNFFKLPDGTTEVRVLPAIDEEDAWYYPTAYHYVNNKYVYCRKYMEDDDAFCPVCSHASKLWKKYKDTNDERIAEEAKSLFAKQQFLCNVVVRNQEGDKVAVIQMPKGVKDDLVSICLDDSYGDITNPVKGRDIAIKRSGKNKATKYQTMVRDRSLLAGDEDEPTEAAELIEEILEKRKVLKDLVKYPSEDDAEKEVKKYLDGETLDGESSKKPSASSAEEDDGDSDEDKDTFDEIEKQLKAAKNKRAK